MLIKDSADTPQRSVASLTPSPAFSCGGRWGWGCCTLASEVGDRCKTKGRFADEEPVPASLALRAALGALGIYRLLISPLFSLILGPACRFEPTCSQYAHQALAQHGLARGLYLTVSRLMRCRPWGGWGYDPVPPPSAHAPAPSLKEKFG